MNRPRPGPKKRKPDPGGGVPPLVLYILVCVVALAWLATVVAGMVNQDYQAPPEVNALFSGVVGGTILNVAHKRRSKGDDEDE